MGSNRVGGLQVPFDATADPTKYFYFVDDFLADVDLWTVTDIAGDAGGSLSVVTTAATLEGAPGVRQLITSATTPAAGDEVGATLAGALTLDSDVNHPVYVGARVRFPSVASVECNVGLFATGLGAGRDTNSISIELDASVSGKLYGVTVKSSTASTVDLGVTPVANTWYLLEVVATRTSVDFFVDGVKKGSLTANIPTDTALVPGVKVATETTAQKDVLIDFFVVKGPASR